MLLKGYSPSVTISITIAVQKRTVSVFFLGNFEIALCVQLRHEDTLSNPTEYFNIQYYNFDTLAFFITERESWTQ